MSTFLLNDFFDYNQEINQLFIHTFLQVPEVPPKSHLLFSHILNAHQIWLNRIHQETPLFDVWQLHEIVDLTALNDRLHQRTKRYLSIPKHFGLEEVIQYKNSKGYPYENTVQEIYLHIINHGTHHRGQIATDLREHDIHPPISDYIFMRRDPMGMVKG